MITKAVQIQRKARLARLFIEEAEKESAKKSENLEEAKALLSEIIQVTWVMRGKA